MLGYKKLKDIFDLWLKITLDSNHKLNFFIELNKFITFLYLFKYVTLFVFIIIDDKISYLFIIIWCLDNLCLYGALSIVYTFFLNGFIKIVLLLKKFDFLYFISSKKRKKFLQNICFEFFFKKKKLLKLLIICGLKFVIKLVDI